MSQEKINKSYKQIFLKTTKGFAGLLPIILGILLLVSLLNVPIFKNIIFGLFSGNSFPDLFVGGLLGSILTGNPVTSYIIGGELLNQGVEIIAVVAFMLAWVTVGVIQLPAETAAFGKKFAFLRNSVSFVSALLISVFVVLTLVLI